MNLKTTLTSAFTFLLLLTYNAGIYAQLSSAEVDSLVDHAMDKFNVAGAAVAIVKDGEIIHKKGYGVKSVKTGKKVSAQTQFAIASNSKAFTTLALAMLVEEGKIGWTDKVVDHIPEFKMYDPYVTSQFNIQDLITHRSGLGLGIGDLMWVPDGSDFTTNDLLTSFRHFEPESAFRTKFDYDNLLYLVAGELIKRKTGMSWAEFIQKKILDPLKMNNTYPTIEYVKDKSTLASPHNISDKGQLNPISHYGLMINGAAAGIYSNVEDLSKWMLMHLNEGHYGKDSTEMISLENQNEMWTIHTTVGTKRGGRYNTHFRGYGLGWYLKDILGNMEVSHTGGLPGMLSRTVMIPDMDLGVVVLTNTAPGGGALFSAVSRTIVDSYLGLEDFKWVEKHHKVLQTRQEKGDSVTNSVWETVEKADPSSVEANNYIGVYKDDWFGKVEVFKKGDDLWFESHRSPKLKGKMYYYKANTFAIKWEYRDMDADAFAIFCLDEEGKAQSIKMKGISPNIDFSFDFHDLDLNRFE